MQIGYERLFNLGDFNHEKFSVSKQVECDDLSTNNVKMMELVWFVANLEFEIDQFRHAKEAIPLLESKINYESGVLEHNSNRPSDDPGRFSEEINI